MSDWYINGVRFTGNVVTVGSGKDYATVAAAISGTSGDLLILLDEGSWASIDLNGITGRNISIKGIGSASNTVLYTSSLPAIRCRAVDNLNLMIESCKLITGSSMYGIQHNLSSAGTLTTILSKCILDFTYLGYLSWVAQESPCSQTAVKFKYCSIDTLASSQNYIFSGWSLYDHKWNISDCEINKCIITHINGTKDTTGTVAISDYVMSAVEGYGPDYGDFLIREGGGVIPRIMNYLKQTRGLN